MIENKGQFQDTPATKKIFSLKQRIRAVAGGTSASKTISILVWLIDYGQSSKNEVMTVVAESVPHLKLGAIRDFKSIMIGQGYWDDNSWNASNFTYTFPNKSVLEFISFDKFGKAHGPRRDVLFLNEANNLPYNIADQLITRTKKIVWMDWNPTNEFWFYTEMLGKRNDMDFLTLTYLDCIKALDQTIIDEIESHKGNKQWWKVYGLGQLGSLEGRIYTDWKVITEIPHEARLERYGLNFGYSNHPLGLIGLYYYNGGYIVDQIMYGLGFSNRMIADTLRNEKPALIIADSAEPKSIQELKDYGLNIVGCEKRVKKTKTLSFGNEQSYVNWSIQIVQGERISITSRSIDVLKEYRNYLWMTDKTTGQTIDKPEEPFHYSMDAVRYAVCSLAPVINKHQYINDEFINSLRRTRTTEEKNPAR